MEYRSIWGAAKSLFQTNGIRGLFQGFTATAVRDAPYAGLSIVFYEKGKDLAGEWQERGTARAALRAGRLVKPEWGVPNAVLHSGSGT
jgi:solute carrier family 25 protein 38